jgi:hypothetical protein
MTDPVVAAVETAATPYRLYIELAAAAVLIGGFAMFVWHERQVGATAVHTADANAQNAARKQAEAESLLNTERATKAEEQAASAQKAIDQYRADHPEQPVSVCHANNRVAVLPAAGAANPGAAAAGSGSAALPQVPDGTPGPDIRPGLDAIVSVAEQLAIRFADLQHREPVSH